MPDEPSQHETLGAEIGTVRPMPMPPKPERPHNIETKASVGRRLAHAAGNAARAASHIGTGIVTDSLGRPWNPALHPRDSRGRFVETGGTARAWGKGLGKVVRVKPNGKVTLRFKDGSTDDIESRKVTMVARPDGTKPTTIRERVAAEDEKRRKSPKRGDGVNADDHGDKDHDGIPDKRDLDKDGDGVRDDAERRRPEGEGDEPKPKKKRRAQSPPGGDDDALEESRRRVADMDDDELDQAIEETQAEANALPPGHADKIDLLRHVKVARLEKRRRQNGGEQRDQGDGSDGDSPGSGEAEKGEGKPKVTADKLEVRPNGQVTHKAKYGEDPDNTVLGRIRRTEKGSSRFYAEDDKGNRVGTRTGSKEQAKAQLAAHLSGDDPDLGKGPAKPRTTPPGKKPATAKKPLKRDEVIFHESYGNVTRGQLAAYKKHNVSPADHNGLVDVFGEDNHAAITEAVKDPANQQGDSGMFNEFAMRRNHARREGGREQDSGRPSPADQAEEADRDAVSGQSDERLQGMAAAIETSLGRKRDGDPDKAALVRRLRAIKAEMRKRGVAEKPSKRESAFEPGERVRILPNVDGEVVGVDPDGRVRVRDDSGRERRVGPDAVQKVSGPDEPAPQPPHDEAPAEPKGQPTRATPRVGPGDLNVGDTVWMAEGGEYHRATLLSKKPHRDGFEMSWDDGDEGLFPHTAEFPVAARGEAHDTPTAANPTPDEGESDRDGLREPGGEVLEDVPAEPVQGSGRPGDVLPGTGGAGEESDRGRTGGRDTGGRPTGEPGLPGREGGARGSEEGSRGEGAGRSGVTGPGAGDRGPSDGGDRPARVGGRGGRRGGKRTGGSSKPVARQRPQRFRPSGQGDLAPKGERAKLDANMAALRLLRQLQSEDRAATPDEQKVLARWAGWGGLKDVFAEDKSRFSAERAELKRLLSPDEYRDARHNVLNAHYTDAGVVDQAWDALAALGFDGGDVLEPGSGSGNFIGRAPDGARMTGVELDPITAAISRHLYPDADIYNESFGKSPFREAVFDAVIGNVPFGEYPVPDKKYNPGNRLSIHDHFIVKSLAETKPGGIAVLVTSQFSLDKQNPEARERMAEYGDLLGAVRLPGKTHADAAGTDVVTDVLVFRRRKDSDAPADKTWLHSSPALHPDGTPVLGIKQGDKERRQHHINDYFRDHPENVLGTVVDGGYNGVDVKADGDTQTRLRKSLSEITEKANAAGRGWNPDRDENLSEVAKRNVGAGRDGRIGYVGKDKDGGHRFEVIEDGRTVALNVPGTQQEELRDLLELRDAADELIEAETDYDDSNPAVGEARKRLNRLYDEYVAKPGRGPITRYTEKHGTDKDGEPTVRRQTPPVMRFLMRDEGAASLFGLEHGYDPGTGNVKKADLFHERQVDRDRAVPERAENAEDALALAAERGENIDAATIGRLLDMPADQVGSMLTGQGLAFLDPDGSGEFIPHDLYQSGNIRQKLEQARELAEQDAKWQPNVAALEEVMPADATLDDVPKQLGAPWMGVDVVREFARELAGTDVGVTYDHEDGWKVPTPTRGRIESQESEWGTDDRSVYHLLESILKQQHKVITVTRKTEDGKKYVDQKASELATAAAANIEAAWHDFLWDNSKVGDRITARYNDRFRSIVPRKASTRRRAYPGMTTGKVLRPHQNAGVNRMVSDESVLLEHAVGAGKTYTLTAGAMELRRLGLANKVALNVPGPLVSQWTADIKELYPSAKVLAVDSDALKGPGARKRFAAKVRNNDWDIVLFTGESFESIPVSEDAYRSYMQEEIDALEARLAKAKARGKKVTVRSIEKQIAQLIARVEEEVKGRYDEGGITFEELGIDYLMVDESHRFKNLPFSTTIQGVQSPQGANRARDMHMKLNLLREHADGRGGPKRVVTFATGTPISNSLAEMYTNERMLRPDLLDETDVGDFDSWAATFSKIEKKIESDNSSTGYVERVRFRGFTDAIGDGLRLWRTFADTVTKDDLRHQGYVKTPKLAGGTRKIHVVERSPEQTIARASLKRRIEKMAGRGKPKKGEDTHVAVIRDGRALAIDPRLLSPRGLDAAGIDPDDPNIDSPKLDDAAASIAAVWRRERTKQFKVNYDDPGDAPMSEKRGAFQMAFIDSSAPKKDRFDAYTALKKRLVAQGMDPKRIRFVQEAAGNPGVKARMMEAARQGDLDLVIGSTEALGTGTNAQNRLVALHHIEGSWKPSDIEQREGRILRQGNQYDEVEVHAYITKGTGDEKTWDMVAYKQHGLDALQRGSYDQGAIDFADDVDPLKDFDTLAGESAEDPLAVDMRELGFRLKELEAAQRQHDHKQARARSQATEGKRDARRLEGEIEQIRQAIEDRVDVSGDAFSMRVRPSKYDQGTALDSREAAAEALKDRFGRMLAGNVPPGEVDQGVVGEVGGFYVRASTVNVQGKSPSIRLDLLSKRGREWDDPLPLNPVRVTGEDVQSNMRGVVTRIENRVTGLDKTRDNLVARHGQVLKEIGAAESQQGKPFRQGDELDSARRRTRLLSVLLNADATNDQGERIPEDAREHMRAEYDRLKGAADEEARRSGPAKPSFGQVVESPDPSEVGEPAGEPVEETITVTPDELRAEAPDVEVNLPDRSSDGDDGDQGTLTLTPDEVADARDRMGLDSEDEGAGDAGESSGASGTSSPGGRSGSSGPSGPSGSGSRDSDGGRQGASPGSSSGGRADEGEAPPDAEQAGMIVEDAPEAKPSTPTQRPDETDWTQMTRADFDTNEKPSLFDAESVRAAQPIDDVGEDTAGTPDMFTGTDEGDSQGGETPTPGGGTGTVQTTPTGGVPGADAENARLDEVDAHAAAPEVRERYAEAQRAVADTDLDEQDIRWDMDGKGRPSGEFQGYRVEVTKGTVGPNKTAYVHVYDPEGRDRTSEHDKATGIIPNGAETQDEAEQMIRSFMADQMNQIRRQAAYRELRDARHEAMPSLPRPGEDGRVERTEWTPEATRDSPSADRAPADRVRPGTRVRAWVADQNGDTGTSARFLELHEVTGTFLGMDGPDTAVIRDDDGRVWRHGPDPSRPHNDMRMVDPVYADTVDGQPGGGEDQEDDLGDGPTGDGEDTAGLPTQHSPEGQTVAARAAEARSREHAPDVTQDPVAGLPESDRIQARAIWEADHPFAQYDASTEWALGRLDSEQARDVVRGHADRLRARVADIGEQARQGFLGRIEDAWGDPDELRRVYYGEGGRGGIQQDSTYLDRAYDATEDAIDEAGADAERAGLDGDAVRAAMEEAAGWDGSMVTTDRGSTARAHFPNAAKPVSAARSAAFYRMAEWPNMGGNPQDALDNRDRLREAMGYSPGGEEGGDTAEPTVDVADPDVTGDGGLGERVYAHVTSEANGGSIRRGGFRSGGSDSLGKQYGDGVYLSHGDGTHEYWAAEFDRWQSGQDRSDEGRTTVYARVRNGREFNFDPFSPAGTLLTERRTLERDHPELVEAFDRHVADGMDERAALGRTVREAGYDHMVLGRRNGDEVVVFDPANVVPVDRDGNPLAETEGGDGGDRRGGEDRREPGRDERGGDRDGGRDRRGDADGAAPDGAPGPDGAGGAPGGPGGPDGGGDDHVSDVGEPDDSGRDETAGQVERDDRDRGRPARRNNHGGGGGNNTGGGAPGGAPDGGRLPHLPGNDDDHGRGRDTAADSGADTPAGQQDETPSGGQAGEPDTAGEGTGEAGDPAGEPTAPQTPTPESVEAEADRAEKRAEEDEGPEPQPLAGEKHPPTRQQQAIYDAAGGRQDVIVEAGAGAGKTSTLEGLARRESDDQIAYVAFNKSVQLEAESRMPGNVEPRTGHSLAYQWATEAMQNRTKKYGLRRGDEVARYLGITSDLSTSDGPDLSPAEQAMAAIRAVDAYASSADDAISREHLPERVRSMPSATQTAILMQAGKAWEDLKTPDGDLRLTLDHVRKMWALSRPDFTKPNSGLARPATRLFLDEAQDTPPVLAKVIADQTIPKVIVGDSDQQIYEFTGARDYLAQADADVRLPLTKSFRFGPAVADVGNRFLQMLGSKSRVEGSGPDSRIVPDMEEPDAILVRSNGGAIGEILREQGQGRRVGVPKGTKKDLTSLVETARYLKGEGPAPDRLHDDLAPYRTWAEVKREAEKGEDAKLAMLTRIVDQTGLDELDGIVQQVTELGDEPMDGVKVTDDGHRLVLSGRTAGLNAALKDLDTPRPGKQKRGLGRFGFYFDKDNAQWVTTKGTPASRERQLAQVREAVARPEIDVMVSTAHKAKGLEWDRVRIGSDFKGPKQDPETGRLVMPPPEELRLAYVAVTRAQKELAPGSLGYVFEYTDENGGKPGDGPNLPGDAPEGADVPEGGREGSDGAAASTDATAPAGAPSGPAREGGGQVEDVGGGETADTGTPDVASPDTAASDEGETPHGAAADGQGEDTAGGQDAGEANTRGRVEDAIAEGASPDSIAGQDRPAGDGDETTEVAASPDDLPEPGEVGGQGAEWVNVGSLRPGDLARVDGINESGDDETAAGHILDFPSPVEAASSDRDMRPMWAVVLGETPDGETGWRRTLYVPRDGMAARAVTGTLAEPKPQGAPETRAEGDVRKGNLPDRLPLDQRGEGIFPGSLVGDREDDRGGIVLGVSTDEVTVRWEGGDTDTVRGDTLTVTDGGRARPDGWSRAGVRLRPGQIVESRREGRGTVEKVDGDVVTFATPKGMRSTNAGHLTVVGQVTDTPDTGVETGTPGGGAAPHAVEVTPADPLPIAPLNGPTVDPLLLPSQRRRVNGLGYDLDRSSDPDVAQAAARVREYLPVSPGQARALADRLRSGWNDRGLRRIADQLDASASEGMGAAAQSALPEGDGRPTPTRGRDLAVGDLVAVPTRDGGVLTGRLVENRPLMGGRLSRLTVDRDGRRVGVTVTGESPAWRLPDLPEPREVDAPDVPEVESRETAAQARERLVASHVRERMAETAQTLATRAAGAAVESEGIHDLRERAAAQLTPEAVAHERTRLAEQFYDDLTRAGLTGKDRDLALARGRDVTAEVEEATREAALRTINDAEPMPGETDQHLAARVADALLDVPDSLDMDHLYDLGVAARGERETADRSDVSPRPDNRSPRERAHAARSVEDEALGELDAVQEELFSAPDTLTREQAEAYAQRAIAAARRSRPQRTQRVSRQVLGGRPPTRGLLARVAALLGRIGGKVAAAIRRLIAAWRSGAPKQRLLDGLARIRAALPQWRATRNLTDMIDAGDLVPGEPSAPADRLAYWQGRLPESGRFGLKRVRGRWVPALRRADLTSGEPIRAVAGERMVLDRARDGGPGVTALTHVEAVKGAGRALDDEVTGLMSARLGADPHGAVKAAEDYADTAERRWRDLFGSGSTEEDAAKAEALQARRDADSRRSEYADALRESALDALSRVRPMGPDGENRLGVKGDREAVAAVRDAERYIPTDWLRAARADTITALDSDRGYYEPETSRMGVHDGARAALHELGHHFESVLPEIADAEWAYHYDRTSTGRPGRRRRDGRNRLVSLARMFPGSGHGDDEVTREDGWADPYVGREYGDEGMWEVAPTGLESLFGGSDYLDADTRRYLLGVLATFNREDRRREDGGDDGDAGGLRPVEPGPGPATPAGGVEAEPEGGEEAPAAAVSEPGDGPLDAADVRNMDLSSMSEDQLAALMSRSSDPEVFEMIAAEMDRRDNLERRLRSQGLGDAPPETPAEVAAEYAVFDDAIDLSGFQPVSEEARAAWASRERAKRSAYDRAVSAFVDYAHSLYVQASTDPSVKGVLTNKAGRAAGVEGQDLFYGRRGVTDAYVRKYASEELLGFFARIGGRPTFEEFAATYLGWSKYKETAKRRRSQSLSEFG